MSVIQKNLRLRQSVGIVNHKDTVEFFNTNTRDSLKLEMHFPNIVQVLSQFDGNNTIKDVLKKFDDLPSEQFTQLIGLLISHHVLIEQDSNYTNEMLAHNHRIINLLEDYKHSTSKVVSTLDNIRNKTVVIIGLGSVGTLIATFLAKHNIKNFILVDNDTVDESNLHRQYFFEKDIGRYKVDVLDKELLSIDASIKCILIKDYLDKDFFSRHQFSHIDLIINCADKPSVDETSKIVAKYAMKENIPHIIGGGYNLHLTLIGQTIIPFKTACFKCFETELGKLNTKDLKNVKKLHRKNRKLGSYPPLSGIASTLASLDAFKILIDEISYLQQVNKRIEFNLDNYEFSSIDIYQDENCTWCGKKENG